MADVFYLNLTPTATHPWWSIWKLAHALVEAGWQIKALGNGTTFKVAGVGGVADPIAQGSADDLWSTFPGSGATAPSSWICLRNPALGFDMVFWRNTTSDTAGKIMIGRSGAFVTAGFPSASATTPGTIPATGVGYLRGSSGAFIGWFSGYTGATGKLQIGVRDAAGAEQGAFYCCGSSPDYGANTWAAFFSFTATDSVHASMGVDPQPYLFHAPYSATGDYNSYDVALAQEFRSDSSTGTQAFWWGWNAQGVWSQFGVAIPKLGSVYLNTTAPKDMYSGTTEYWLDKHFFCKEQTAAEERKGYARSFRIVDNAVAQYSTFGSSLWAKLAGSAGSGLIFWDGVTGAPVAI